MSNNNAESAKAKLRYKSLTAWILVVSFAVSFITLIIYLAEADFYDDVLFFLLAILRYSSFMVSLCSLYKILMHVYGLFRGYKFRPKKFFIFLGMFLYGILIILFEALIVAVSRGNG
jgi:hypothetical protein